jgi:hypothetical protein
MAVLVDWGTLVENQGLSRLFIYAECDRLRRVASTYDGRRERLSERYPWLKLASLPHDQQAGPGLACAGSDPRELCAEGV